MERFLYRLTKSAHVDCVLLKGALLLQQAGIPRARPTMDIDFLRQGSADRHSLDQPALKIRAYPIEAVIAEKFQAMVELDLANSRVKDFYDVWVYSRNVDFDGETLAKSLAATFGRRQTPLPTELPMALRPIYFDADSHRNQWQAFVRHIGETDLSSRFAEVIHDIAKFAMPPAISAARLEPFQRRWFSPGPWEVMD